MKNKLVLFSIILFSLSACKRYDSDKVNKQLLQGKWLLVAAKYASNDTIIIDYSKEITYITFEGNKCIQIMSDLGKSSDYTFDVNDFILSLYQNDSLINKSKIRKLTSDSLILINEVGLMKYKKQSRNTDQSKAVINSLQDL